LIEALKNNDLKSNESFMTVVRDFLAKPREMAGNLHAVLNGHLPTDDHLEKEYKEPDVMLNILRDANLITPNEHELALRALYPAQAPSGKPVDAKELHVDQMMIRAGQLWGELQ